MKSSIHQYQRYKTYRIFFWELTEFQAAHSVDHSLQFVMFWHFHFFTKMMSTRGTNVEVPFLDAAQGCEKVISLRLKQAQWDAWVNDDWLGGEGGEDNAAIIFVDTGLHGTIGTCGLLVRVLPSSMSKVSIPLLVEQIQ